MTWLPGPLRSGGRAVHANRRSKQHEQRDRGAGEHAERAHQVFRSFDLSRDRVIDIEAVRMSRGANEIWKLNTRL